MCGAPVRTTAARARHGHRMCARLFTKPGYEAGQCSVYGQRTASVTHVWYDDATQGLSGAHSGLIPGGSGLAVRPPSLAVASYAPSRHLSASHLMPWTGLLARGAAARDVNLVPCVCPPPKHGARASLNFRDALSR